MQDQPIKAQNERKIWAAPERKRIVGGSAEFGTGAGNDGSGTS